MTKGNTLTPQQEKFVENLVRGMSIVDAYKKAGYKSNGNAAYSHASRMVRNGKIRDEIKERLADGSIHVKALAPKAIETLLWILSLDSMQDGKLDLRVVEEKRKVAESILDRAGLKPELVARLVGDEKQPIFVTFEGLDNGGSK